MPVSNEDKIQLLSDSINEMALLGYRLDKLLIGFKLYDSKKNTLNINEYEEALNVYHTALKAMEEQMQRYHRLFDRLNNTLKEGGE